MAQDVTIRFKGDTSNLDRALSNINRSMRTMERNSERSNRALRGINASAVNVTNTLRLAGAALVGFATGSVIRSIVDTTSRFQDLRTALASVTGGAREGAEAFEFISEFSTKTQFGIEELTQTYIKLRAAGIQPTQELLTTFTDTAAVTTDQIGSLQAITDLFSRTTAGGLGLEELNRLADRGIPVFDILQEKLGKNRLELSELGKTAEGANLITKALQEGLNARFGGATAARINNVSTQFSNLQIAIQNASDTVGRQGFALALGQTAVEITNLISKNKALVQEVGVRLTQAFLIVKGAIKLAIDNIKFLGLAFGAFFALNIARAVGGLALAFGSTLVKGIVLAGRALKALTVITMSNPLIAAAVVIAGGIEYLTGAFSKLFSTITNSDTAESTLESLKGAMGELGDQIGLNTDSFEEFFRTIGASEEEARKLAEQAAALAEQNQTVADTGSEITNNYRDQVSELEKKKKTFSEILTGVQNEYELSRIALEQDYIKQELMKAELELGRSLTEEERQRLSLQLQSIKVNRQALAHQNKLLAMANDIADTVTQGLTTELQLLQDAQAEAEKVLRDRLDQGIIDYGTYYVGMERLDDEYRRRKDDLDRKLEDRLTNYRMQSIERSLAYGRKALAEALSDEDKAFLQRVGQNEKQEQIVKDRIEFEKKSETEKWQWAISEGASAFEALGRYNKQAFEASKALRIAEAIMNTYTGATLALATYPPPFNFIGAAAVVAAGLANIATIRSQSYSGRQLGGAVSMGESYLVGETGPEIFTPGKSGRIDRIEGGGQPVEITFNINAVDAASVDELLVQRKGTIQQIISDAMLERGQRSRF